MGSDVDRCPEGALQSNRHTHQPPAPRRERARRARCQHGGGEPLELRCEPGRALGQRRSGRVADVQWAHAVRIASHECDAARLVHGHEGEDAVEGAAQLGGVRPPPRGERREHAAVRRAGRRVQPEARGQLAVVVQLAVAHDSDAVTHDRLVAVRAEAVDGEPREAEACAGQRERRARLWSARVQRGDGGVDCGACVLCAGAKYGNDAAHGVCDPGRGGLRDTLHA